MKRRSYLSAMFAGLAGLRCASAQTPKKPIVLYCDLEVAPDKEQEMLHNYHIIFRPASVKYRGYIDLKMLKLRSTLSGTAPVGINYRFQLTYFSEEARQKWIHSDVHARVWPTIENLLSNKSTYTTLLFNEV